MKKYCIGIDVGGTTVKIGLFEINGKLMEKWEIPTRREENGKYILNDIKQSVLEKITHSDIDISDVEGVGIGVPGSVTKDGTVLGCVNLGWGIFNLESEVKELFPNMTVKVGNDANVAALGELWQGSAKGYLDAVMVTLGTGVGGGIIIGGKIVTGATGGAGEIGHMPVNPNETEHCNCGKQGCLEQYVSATGIVRTAKILLRESDEKSALREYDIEKITAKDVFDCAKARDIIATMVVSEFGYYLGTAFAHVASVVNPEVFVIGGGVSKAGEIIIDAVEHYYRKLAFPACKNAEIILAGIGNDAGIYGAAALVAEND